MQNYLSGYLSVLPLVQRERIIELLKKNEDYRYSVVSSSQFDALVEQITTKHTQASEYLPQEDRLDSNIHNEFFSRVYTDLVFMFNESNLINRALVNYKHLVSSELSDLTKEMLTLNTQVDNLKESSKADGNLIVKTETFKGDAFSEDPEGIYAHLFCDRDGGVLNAAPISTSNKKNMLTLKISSIEDAIHAKNGLLTANVEILDQRGHSKEVENSNLDKILDGSTDTAWISTAHSGEGINVPMHGVEGPGAMTKLSVTFNAPTMISEISLTPFGVYPLEVSAILYEKEVEYTAHTDTVPPTQKYIVTSSDKEGVNAMIDAKCTASDTMVFSFPSILVKRLIFVLKQENFTQKDSYDIAWDLEEKQLWDIISSNKSERDKQKQRFNLYLKSAKGGHETYGK